MGRSTVHYGDSDTNNILKKLHNKLRPAGTPVQRVEYIIELLLLRIFEVKIKQDPEFKQLRNLFKEPNEQLLFSSLYSVANERLLPTLNEKFFPFYASILSQARKVYTTNLSQKVRDQLVLIEEVFKNSNFTNNVKSGNLQEVLGLIAEIDEDRLLKTDLLGDAIESALSETGGTKDIGLHRTPDHIRQFMVAMVSPKFDDTIFDPACGTAGFLFDSFGYALESVSQDGHWPGPKAHPEMQAYFKKYFAKRQAPMPSHDKAITFYRTGIFGIEYLGMIRKMAAINFYIRGLNPQNIEQGDSLAAFDPVKDGGSKTVVLANPPFGAERDQDAYPNVWEEFSRESETTILFVKLMFDALAPGGRCAVIVSEGFLTWDQTSARTLRKMLIENANLRAIISLPQGVFVSKGGVGPKTSILIFDKSGPTKEVWFYKVTNDGYTMGTNRRPIEGCQLVEALDLYEKYVQHGKTPPETKHSFSVPADWILALDPRVKLRIQDETIAEFSVKAEKESKRLVAKLAEQAEQGKITAQDRDEKLTQYDEIWKNKTLNEIAKRIERAHLYSFNLPNCRSNLSAYQHDEWKKIFNGTMRTNEKTLDDRYDALRDCPPEKAHAALALLNGQNALEFDIARQYLMSLPIEALAKHNQLATLRTVIESGARYPRVRLGNNLRLNTHRINPSDFSETRFRVLGVSNTEGVFLNETKPGSEIRQAYYRVEPNEFCYNPYRVNVGSIGLNKFDYDNQIISGAYNVFATDETELLPEFLMALFKSPQFLTYVNEKAHGGVRMNFKFEYLEGWEIPLPSYQQQADFTQVYKKVSLMRESAAHFIMNWEPLFPLFEEYEEKSLGEVCQIIMGQSPPGDSYNNNGEGVPLINGPVEFGPMPFSQILMTKYTTQATKMCKKGDLLVCVRGSTTGRTNIAGFDACIGRGVAALRAIGCNQKYVNYWLFTQRQQLYEMGDGTTTFNNITADTLQAIKIVLPNETTQKAVVDRLDVEVDTLQRLTASLEYMTEYVNDMFDQLWGKNE
ncbi:MAG: N-6 DNA methylase [Thermodesulfobacteriota bacterium]|jgi:type I restriction-modification system DNA methylase subunit